jgi:hypothetical protein
LIKFRPGYPGEPEVSVDSKLGGGDLKIPSLYLAIKWPNALSFDSSLPQAPVVVVDPNAKSPPDPCIPPLVENPKGFARSPPTKEPAVPRLPILPIKIPGLDVAPWYDLNAIYNTLKGNVVEV